LSAGLKASRRTCAGPSPSRSAGKAVGRFQASTRTQACGVGGCALVSTRLPCTTPGVVRRRRGFRFGQRVEPMSHRSAGRDHQPAAARMLHAGQYYALLERSRNAAGPKPAAGGPGGVDMCRRPVLVARGPGLAPDNSGDWVAGAYINARIAPKMSSCRFCRGAPSKSTMGRIPLEMGQCRVDAWGRRPTATVRGC